VRQRRRSERLGALLAAVLAAGEAHARGLQPIVPIERSPVEGRTLQLEVVINGRSTHVIVPAKWTPDGGVAVERGDLADAGVKAPGRGARSDTIDLARSGLTYRYDEPAQKLHFELSDDQRMPKIYDSRGEPPPVPPPTRSWGALMNYTLYSGASSAFLHWDPNIQAASLSPDVRIFNPYGELEQSFIVGRTLQYDLFRFRDTSTMRLDSTYTYADYENRTNYVGGDAISGGFEWTRPLRFGGLQLQHNFGLRSDIVTTPLPSLSGSAAAPSSVDVFVKGEKAFTQQVEEGPFRITNLPVSSPDGKAEVVVRDATGRETRSEISLLSGERMMPPGQFDYTLEAGLARRFYALRSDDYDRSPIGTGSFRYGLNERVTLQAHGEGGARLGNGGVGAVAWLNGYGTLAAAVGGSTYQGRFGGQGYASYMFPRLFGFSLGLSAQRTCGGYEDLASATAPNRNGVLVSPFLSPGFPLVQNGYGAGSPIGAGAASNYNVLPPRAIDRATPVWGLGGNLSASLAQMLRAPQIGALANLLSLLDPLAPYNQSNNSRIASVSYTRALPHDGNLFVTVQADFGGTRGRGVFAGATFPLWGNDIHGTFGAQTTGDGTNGRGPVGFNAQVQKSLGGEPGSYGFGVNATQGENPARGGNVSYRSPLGLLRADGLQQGSLANASMQLEGAVAAADWTVVAGPKVDDAFAVVNAGASNVTVLRDGSPVGKTNFFGGLLVPSLRSYERNKISIDANSLPPDAIPATTEQLVAPMHRSGVGVDFGVKARVKSAVLILIDPSGKPIETGSRGRLESGGAFMVGYDGRVFIREAFEQNELVVDLGDHDCRASFSYAEVAASKGKLKAVCQ